jgi:hypothetical protein
MLPMKQVISKTVKQNLSGEGGGLLPSPLHGGE